MDKHMKQTIEHMIDRINDEKPRLETELRGMSYAQGMLDALEWALGQTTDEELLNRKAYHVDGKNAENVRALQISDAWGV